MQNNGTNGLEKRRIMRALKINEISAVDRPAQEGARALILKRADEPDDIPQKGAEKRGVDYVDFLTGSAAGHQHGVRVGNGGDGISLVVSYAGEASDSIHDHQVVRQGDQWVMSENAGHAHELDQEAIDQAVTAFMTKGEAPTTQAGATGEPGQEENIMSDENQAAIDELTKRAERAEAIASMDADTRAHFDGLSKSDQDAFVALDEDKRTEVVKAAADANAVVYTAEDGTEYRKSDDPRLVSMARRNDLLAKGLEDAAVAKADAQVEEIAKSLEHLPGDLEARKALVKSVQTIGDETQRDAAMAALKAQDAALAKAFKSVGSTGATAPTSGPEQELEDLAKAHMDDKGGTYSKAYDAVLKTAKGRELYAQTVN